MKLTEQQFLALTISPACWTPAAIRRGKIAYRFYCDRIGLYGDGELS
jgi:hypothetical protein